MMVTPESRIAAQTDLAQVANLDEMERIAMETLSGDMVAKLTGGFNDDQTYQRTFEAMAATCLLPRRLTAVDPDPAVELFGAELAFPVVPAPASPHWRAHPDAELGVTRAAHSAGTAAIVPCFGSTSFSDNSQVGQNGPMWAQIFPLRDRGQARDQVQLLMELGYSAAFLTVDSPVSTLIRQQESGRPPGPAGGSSGYDLLATTAPGASWEYLEWLSSTATIPIVLKGTVRADMATRAVAHGAASVVVTSHGSRLFDGQSSGLDVLSEVSDALGGRVPLLYDGSVRRGAHVLRAIAEGADAVLIGRPIFHGLAVQGEAGVRRVFEILYREVIDALRLLGVGSPDELGRITRALRN